MTYIGSLYNQGQNTILFDIPHCLCMVSKSHCTPLDFVSFSHITGTAHNDHIMHRVRDQITPYMHCVHDCSERALELVATKFLNQSQNIKIVGLQI